MLVRRKYPGAGYGVGAVREPSFPLNKILPGCRIHPALDFGNTSYASLQD
jgi:hypothetical protein